MSCPTDSIQRQLLAEALHRSRYLLNDSSKLDRSEVEQCQERLRQIRETLKTFAHPISRGSLAAEQIPLPVRQAFAKATVLLSRYRDLGGTGWQGTLTSPTLSQYAPDPVPAAFRDADGIDRLCQIFALSAADRSALLTALATLDHQIDQQKQLIQAVLADDEATATPDPQGRSHLFTFHQLFGTIPIPAEAIACIHTDMQIYFCIDYQDGQLRDPVLWQRLSQAEQQQVQTFLLSLKQFSFEQFRRFPTFGPCDPHQMNLEWCDRVAHRSGLSCSEVVRSLSRSIGVIPTQKAEAFLLHDIWGHHWQLMLTQFESDYSILTTCDDPLRAAETAYTPEGPLTCRELFTRQVDQVAVDVDRAKLFFHAEVQQRLGLLFTHLIGEMIADVAEFKFVWDHPDLADQLLSSSLFKAQPTKLDLSLADVDFLFLRVLQPLLEVRVSVVEESSLEAELLAEWTRDRPDTLELRTSLKVAIVQLYQIFLQEYNRTYLPTLTGDVGVFTKIVSNLLYLQNVINSLYTDLTSEAHPSLPFQDLLTVFIGCYCSSDSYAEFWAIDDVLAAYFLPCWYLLSERATQPPTAA